MDRTTLTIDRAPESRRVGLDQTRERAGPLLEQGVAFTRLEGPALEPGRAADDGASTAHAPAQDAGQESAPDAQRLEVVVIGGGQAGLSVGYHLARQGRRFVILDAHPRVGDSWRRRWDSLRLFTPARYDGLVGMPFPAPAGHFPTKDQMGDYLEAYAHRFALPVRSGVRVDELSRVDDRYLVRAGRERYIADHVVVAAASYQKPKLPPFAGEFDPAIRQLHSLDYRSPAQLAPGSALVVGAGNSGAEIAMDLARSHQVWLAGRHPGHLPVAFDGVLALHVVVPVVFRLVFHRLLSMDTPLGPKVRPHFLDHGGPLIRVKPKDLDRAGVRRLPRLAGVRDGAALMEDGRRIEVENIVWCTGLRPGLDWIRLPIVDERGRPRQFRGVAAGEPGLYFAGLAFQHSPSSTMVHGAARDALRVAERIAARIGERRSRAAL